MSAFYRAFEEQFRGTRDTIISRLGFYRPFLQPLSALGVKPKALDLGCGRGEWLEVLKAHGFDGVGVDTDAAMLAAARRAGLLVYEEDALAYLRTQDSNSQAVISAFHLVEHLPFASLQAVLDEAFRVLCPGGLLILETPNPENISVGCNSFYLDPTHQRPLPPDLLRFLTEHHGAARTVIARLQHLHELESETRITLLQVLTQVSPDYAVIAQKAGLPSQMAAFDALFAKEYGLSLLALAQRFDQRLLQQEQALRCQAQHLEALRGQLIEIQQQIDRAQQITNSLSWKITAPLRWTLDGLLHTRRTLSARRAQLIFSLQIKLSRHRAGRIFLVNLWEKFSFGASLLRRFHPAKRARTQPKACRWLNEIRAADDLSPQARHLYHAIKQRIPPACRDAGW